MADRIESRARFDLIRYANVWEDAEVLCAALQPAEGKRILSIASGGDNAFALLASGAEVVAADLSAAQLALVELKRAAMRSLSQPRMLAFLGFGEAGGEIDRLAIYAGLEAQLPEEARAYWRSQEAAIRDGVGHAGKFERYFRLLRERLLPLLHRRSTVLDLMAERDEAARTAFYRERWDNLRWRLLFRIFFSRFVMGRLGRDPEFFRYVEGSVAERILTRVEYALTRLPNHANPYLEAILTGGFRRALPLYLRPEVYPHVQRHLDRLILFQGPIDAACEASRFDGFNLSDLFEYLDPEASAAVYARLVEASRPGARLAYWNMLVPRRLAASHPRARHLEEESRRLFARDYAFFYSAFVLDEVFE
jgi:S-adenosylmethionine-diacylglycerol 3-amino-3-carboxypropyl transferase